MSSYKENLIKCPICNEGTLHTKQGEFVTELKNGIGKKELKVENLLWEECDTCGEKIFDNDAVKRISDSRYNALGLLTPNELKEIRKKLGYTQEQMAAFLGIGNKTYCRWENGVSIQTKSMDTLIRIATKEKFEELKKKERIEQAKDYLARLKERRSQIFEKKEMKLAAHSRALSPSEMKKLGSKIFEKKSD